MLQLRSLQHLVVLAGRLNFARAAEDVGISQSALSRSIQALERQLGLLAQQRRVVSAQRKRLHKWPAGENRGPTEVRMKTQGTRSEHRRLMRDARTTFGLSGSLGERESAHCIEIDGEIL